MATLTTKSRKALPASDFAIPADRAYPIPDKAHARDALARVAANGSPSEKAEVAGAVHRKFPAIDKGPTDLGSHEKPPHRLARKVHGERMAEHEAAR